MARILVTEDDDAVRSFVKRALELDGHTVEIAEDGAQAVDVIKQAGGDFDLLLSDIKMPVMDGIALALVVARDWPSLRILLMTGFADQRERAHNLEALVHDVVTKPFSLADIRRAVSLALAGVIDDDRSKLYA
ncbi:response regulator receiver domain-containing protein [Breoghania corrubedonensis]|uniref:Response regulator receiver domain-containing protein n=1 Tax=Breoghania corrubedonensis TaxID=665038 RepID=A0A2T5VHT4_9HYPH|nr:response regulator [Breoghania corrubedonensis]PTW63304.1 response regulator receiver domain-containing protein [Breoghania corrubedonensis]